MYAHCPILARITKEGWTKQTRQEADAVHLECAHGTLEEVSRSPRTTTSPTGLKHFSNAVQGKRSNTSPDLLVFSLQGEFSTGEHSKV